MNLLTFDIEEWYLESCRGGRANKYSEYDKYLNALLEKLNKRSLKATFFCVGEMGRLFPYIVRKIKDQGHEIGCHSNIHTWLNKMTEDECREDTRKAIDSLEQCIGEKIVSYRAPAFSIGERNKWAFEVLVENGIKRDASIFPATRSFGGFASFRQKTPCIVNYNSIQIKEFPICTTKVFAQEIAYSGGGYFRFFPLWYVEKEIKKSLYAMCYFHIGDLMPEMLRVQTRAEYENYFKEKGTLKARYMRFVKANFGKKKALSKVMKLIEDVDFININQADTEIDWDNIEIVNI